MTDGHNTVAQEQLLVWSPKKIGLWIHQMSCSFSCSLMT